MRETKDRQLLFHCRHKGVVAESYPLVAASAFARDLPVNLALRRHDLRTLLRSAYSRHRRAPAAPAKEIAVHYLPGYCPELNSDKHHSCSLKSKLAQLHQWRDA